MRSAFQRLSSNLRSASFRRRGPAFVLALLAHVLLLILLLRQAAFPVPPPEVPMSAFHLLPEPRKTPSPKPAPRAKTVAKVKRSSGGSPARTPTPPQEPTTPLNILPIDLASSDISKMPSHQKGAGSGRSTGEDSGATTGGGDGPGGGKLYNAEWYVEPTNAQLAYYLPKTGTITGWGLIACRTVARYRVEDCVPIGESPVGSGIARAVVEAAWQFRVLPPRIGGNAMVGAWVRIRIEYTKGVPSDH